MSQMKAFLTFFRKVLMILEPFWPSFRRNLSQRVLTEAIQMFGAKTLLFCFAVMD